MLSQLFGSRHRVLEEGQTLERALFWGRVAGGAILLVLGPAATPNTPAVLIRGLGIYFVAYAALMLWVTARAETPRDQRRAGWLAHVFDTFGFLSGLALNATDPQWLASNAAPLYVFVSVTRLGALGGVTAVTALAITHFGLAIWRDVALGITFDLGRTLVYVSIYALAALLTGAIDRELRALRARRDVQVEFHEPLLRAHDEMGQGVVVTDGGRAVYVSDGFLALTGRTRGEVTALADAYSLLPEDDRIRPAVESGGSPRVLVRKDGERRNVELSIRHFSARGRDRAVAIVSDVTVRDRTLEELERKQRLDSLGALAGGVAHDFNNLLAVIMNNAYLALDTPGVDIVRSEIDEIREAAERGLQLTRQMLVFAAGDRPRPAGPVDIGREAKAAERLLRRAAGKGISLEMHVPEDLPRVTLGPGQLDQILMNLVVNARDALPSGGHITVELAAVAVDDDAAPVPPGRYVRIAVEDDGAGMSSEIASRALEPFFTTKPRGAGTGLGLFTVHGIVRRAGGHVAIASALSRGTRVAIHLPVVAEKAELDKARVAVDAQGEGATILVVDDEPQVLRSTAQVLRRTGYRVLEAGSPTEALAAAGAGIDLLVCDVVLPERSGHDLVAEMRATRPELPVVFVSGYAPVDPGSSASDPFVGKPFATDALLAAVRQALRTAPRKG